MFGNLKIFKSKIGADDFLSPTPIFINEMKKGLYKSIIHGILSIKKILYLMRDNRINYSFDWLHI